MVKATIQQKALETTRRSYMIFAPLKLVPQDFPLILIRQVSYYLKEV